MTPQNSPTPPNAGSQWPAATAWLQAPEEKAPQFFPTYSNVSVSLQSALRQQLPAAFFGYSPDSLERLDLDALADLHTIYPLLVYACSQPFPGRPRTDFTYDVLNTALMARFFRSVRKELPKALTRISEHLAQNGCTGLLRAYAPHKWRDVIETVQTKKKCRLHLNGLLSAENGLINELLRFSAHQQWTPTGEARAIARFEKGWSTWLHRLYASRDFTFLGAQLLQVATNALEQGDPVKNIPKQ